jgi:hypothetical protein
MPMAVMAVPVTLFLGQLSLWYQQRPLRIGEEAVVSVRLSGDSDSPLPEVSLEQSTAFEATLGPKPFHSRREVFWSIKAQENGYHRLVFRIGEQTVDKELAIGDGFMRVSTQRPGWVWSDILLHPAEQPFHADSSVQAIAIDYPTRSWWTRCTDSWAAAAYWFIVSMIAAPNGTDAWVAYWFAASMIAALCFRRALNVNV